VTVNGVDLPVTTGITMLVNVTPDDSNTVTVTPLNAENVAGPSASINVFTTDNSCDGSPRIPNKPIVACQ
jgi:hypothetical protein